MTTERQCCSANPLHADRQPGLRVRIWQYYFPLVELTSDTDYTYCTHIDTLVIPHGGYIIWASVTVKLLHGAPWERDSVQRVSDKRAWILSDDNHNGGADVRAADRHFSAFYWHSLICLLFDSSVTRHDKSVLKLPAEAGAAAHVPARTKWRTRTGEPLQTQTGSISLCRPGVELQNVDEDIRKSHPKLLFNHGNLDLPWLHYSIISAGECLG